MIGRLWPFPVKVAGFEVFGEPQVLASMKELTSKQ
jgi:hypothetical protein